MTPLLKLMMGMSLSSPETHQIYKMIRKNVGTNAHAFGMATYLKLEVRWIEKAYGQYLSNAFNDFLSCNTAQDGITKAVELAKILTSDRSFINEVSRKGTK